MVRDLGSLPTLPAMVISLPLLVGGLSGAGNGVGGGVVWGEAMGPKGCKIGVISWRWGSARTMG